jgi:hypothetical protein
MILGAWKAHDPYGDANIEFANPALGWVRFEFDENDYSFDHHIFHFRQTEMTPDVIV